MATTTINYLSLTGLASYDVKIKEFIAAKVNEGDAKSFKFVNLENGVLKFYTVNPITENTVADFEIELPEQDLSNLMQLVENATAGNIATFGENGQVVDSGVAVADLATKEEVGAVDTKVDELAELVGELPEGTSAASVVEYVNIKTAGIATDTALEELNNQVAGLQTAVQGIQEDYLVEADKTELQGNIDAVDVKVVAIEKDYLKASDKKELQDQITANENAIELLTNGVDSETIDGVNDLITYVNEHGAEVTKMQGDIANNAAAIKSEEDARKAADELLSGRLDTLEAIDFDAYVDADVTLKEELQVEINKKADASVVTALDEAYKTADEAIDARIVIVEGKAHEHANKDVLDGISTEDVAAWDNAVAKTHEHVNKDVIDGITVEKVTAWDGAEANAKAYVDEKIGQVDLSGIATNAGAIEVLEGQVSTLEGDIAALKEVEHEEITTEQIDALFA